MKLGRLDVEFINLGRLAFRKSKVSFHPIHLHFGKSLRLSQIAQKSDRELPARDLHPERVSRKNKEGIIMDHESTRMDLETSLPPKAWILKGEGGTKKMGNKTASDGSPYFTF